MLVHVDNQQSDVLIDLSKLQQIVSELLDLENKRCDEVALHFVSTKEIRRLHKIYFNDPTTTDCITLPLDSAEEEGYCMLGDIFVCPKTAKDYISKEGGDLFEEITLYVIHGLLHLLHYDDIEDADEKQMRAAERRHMKNLKAKDLLLSPGSP